MRALLQGLLDLVLPTVCCRCERAVTGGDALCSGCAGRLRHSPREPTPRGVASCTAAVAYEGDAIEWMRRFKYPRPGLAGIDPAALCVLRSLAREAARAAAVAPQLVVPVPQYPKRLRSRGFNPAALLARSVAREFATPFDPVLLERVRDTASQTGLTRTQRRRNVRGAFRVRPGGVVPARVALVDDVVTTGSTLAAAAQALLRAGAKKVDAICVARTAGHGGEGPV
ncbi:MAG: ComF family protein [Myxococcota bacterium]